MKENNISKTVTCTTAYSWKNQFYQLLYKNHKKIQKHIPVKHIKGKTHQKYPEKLRDCKKFALEEYENNTSWYFLIFTHSNKKNVNF